MGMIWKLTPLGKTRSGMPGVPWRDLTDEEMAAAVERHPGIDKHGYFERVEVQDEEPKSSRRRAAPEEK